MGDLTGSAQRIPCLPQQVKLPMASHGEFYKAFAKKKLVEEMLQVMTKINLNPLFKRNPLSQALDSG